MKCKPLEGMNLTENAEMDYKKARRYGQYKIGEEALFYPDKSYILKKDLSEIVETKAAVPTKGCCGMVLSSPAVEFMACGKKIRLITDSEKQSRNMIEALLDKSTKREGMTSRKVEK